MRAYLRGTNSRSFRPHEPAEIIGVEFVAPKANLYERICFRIRFADGQEDIVPVFAHPSTRMANPDYELISETTAIHGRPPIIYW